MYNPLSLPPFRALHSVQPEAATGFMGAKESQPKFRCPTHSLHTGEGESSEMLLERDGAVLTGGQEGSVAGTVWGLGRASLLLPTFPQVSLVFDSTDNVNQKRRNE